jgi:hypothetical protein
MDFGDLNHTAQIGVAAKFYGEDFSNMKTFHRPKGFLPLGS